MFVSMYSIIIIITYNELTFSSTVFLIFMLASLTVFPALFTAEYKKLPKDFAPIIALFDTETNKTQHNVISCKNPHSIEYHKINAIIFSKRTCNRMNEELIHS